MPIECQLNIEGYVSLFTTNAGPYGLSRMPLMIGMPSHLTLLVTGSSVGAGRGLLSGRALRAFVFPMR